MRVFAIILNVGLLLVPVRLIQEHGFQDLQSEPTIVLWVLLSLAVPIANFFAKPLFVRRWIRRYLKGKTLEEQIKIVEQARLDALKRESKE